MGFYGVQCMLDYRFKLGTSNDDRIAARIKEHGTIGGPIWTLGWALGHSREFESAIFERLASWRVSDPHEDRRDYEIFMPDVKVIEFLRGAFMRESGFVVQARPRDPLKQTARDWLKTVKCIGKDRKIGRAARWALDEDSKLRRMVPKSARGGWDLSESLGGKCATLRQLSFQFAECQVEREGWMVHRVTYKGTPFFYPVFAEWWAREQRTVPPSNVIRANVPIQRAKVMLGPRPKHRHATPDICLETERLPW